MTAHLGARSASHHSREATTRAAGSRRRSGRHPRAPVRPPCLCPPTSQREASQPCEEKRGTPLARAPLRDDCGQKPAILRHSRKPHGPNARRPLSVGPSSACCAASPSGVLRDTHGKGPQPIRAITVQTWPPSPVCAQELPLPFTARRRLAVTSTRGRSAETCRPMVGRADDAPTHAGPGHVRVAPPGVAVGSERFPSTEEANREHTLQRRHHKPPAPVGRKPPLAPHPVAPLSDCCPPALPRARSAPHGRTRDG